MVRKRRTVSSTTAEPKEMSDMKYDCAVEAVTEDAKRKAAATLNSDEDEKR